MARIPSNMLPLGSKLTDKTLPNTLNGKDLDLYNYIGDRPSLLMFICNHCPFVIHLHVGIQNLYTDYKSKDLAILAISANDVVNYPEDSPEKMKALFENLGLDFPYLYDENQDFTKSLDAACTPDFFLFDKEKNLVYRGRFDESRPGNGIAVSGNDIRAALDAVMKGEFISTYQKPSMGCNIKWKE